MQSIRAIIEEQSEEILKGADKNVNEFRKSLNIAEQKVNELKNALLSSGLEIKNIHWTYKGNFTGGNNGIIQERRKTPK